MPTGIFPMSDNEFRYSRAVQFGRPTDKWTLRYQVASALSVTTDTGDGDATYSHSAAGLTQYTPNAVNVYDGISLQVSSTWDGSAGTYTYFYDGPGAPFGGLSITGSTYKSSLSIEARFVNLMLYVSQGGALLRIFWNSVDIYVDGSLYVSLPGSSGDYTSAGVGPCYIPILGIPLTVTGSRSAGRTNTGSWSYDACDPDNASGYDWETAVEQTISGGWQILEESGGTWADLPVSPYNGTAPSGNGCPFGIGSYTVPADSTWGTLLTGKARSAHAFAYEGRIDNDITVKWYCGETLVRTDGPGPAECTDPCGGGFVDGYWDTYATTTTTESEGGTVMLQPNLAKSFDRFAPLFAKLIYHQDYPETRAALSRVCVDGGVTNSTTNTPTVHAALSVFLGLVQDTDHAALDPLDGNTYAPCSGGKSKAIAVSYQSFGPETCVCPPSWAGSPPTCPGGEEVPVAVCGSEPLPYEDNTQSENTTLTFPSYVGTVSNYLSHAEEVPTYLNTWGNPHWGMFDWRDDWYLQGTDAPWAPPSEEEPGYWGPIRDQWCYNASLPSGENHRTRLHMIASPYYNTAHTPFLDEYCGGRTWNGISRYIVRDVDFLSSITLTEDSEPMLSSPDESCSIAVAPSGITLTPTGSTIKLDIDLVRADCYPFYGLLLALSAKFPDWTNIDSVTAKLVSSIGAEKALNNGAALVRNTVYTFKRANDDGYAGTWGSENGNDYLTDIGTDVPTGGNSVAVMADDERMIGFQMLPDATGSKLSLTIQVTDSGTDVTLDWPVFARPTTHPSVRWLDGNRAALFWPDGPAVLWGCHLSYVPDVGLYWPWLPKGLGVPNTLADALQFIYAIFECKDPGDVPALNAEVTGWYDSFECSLANVGSADKFSMSLLLPKRAGSETIRFAIIQTIAEIPPLSCWPVRSRSTSNWQDNGDFALQRWDQAQEVNYLIGPAGAALVLKSPSDVTLSTSDTGIAGWAVQKYTLPLDGDEANDYMFTSNGTTYATAYPWRGEFWLGNRPFPPTATGIVDIHQDIRRFVAYIKDGTVWVWFFDVDGTSSDLDADATDTGIEADWVRGAWLRSGAVSLLVGNDGTVSIWNAPNEGGTFSLATSVGDGTSGDIRHPDDASPLVYRIDGGTLKWAAYDSDFNLINSGDTNLTGLDDAPLAFDVNVAATSGLQYVVFVAEGGTNKVYRSSDGVTFS